MIEKLEKLLGSSERRGGFNVVLAESVMPELLAVVRAASRLQYAHGPTAYSDAAVDVQDAYDDLAAKIKELP